MPRVDWKAALWFASSAVSFLGAVHCLATAVLLRKSLRCSCGRLSLKTAWMLAMGMGMAFGVATHGLAGVLYLREGDGVLQATGPFVRVVWLVLTTAHAVDSCGYAVVVVAAYRGKSAQASFGSATIDTKLIEKDAGRMLCANLAARLVVTILGLLGFPERFGHLIVVSSVLHCLLGAMAPVAFFRHVWPLRRHLAHLPADKSKELLTVLNTRRLSSVRGAIQAALGSAGVVLASQSPGAMAVVVFASMLLGFATCLATTRSMVRRERRKKALQRLSTGKGGHSVWLPTSQVVSS